MRQTPNAPTNAATALKKELGLLGSFSMGFADVGAGVFLSLGLIAAFAHGYLTLAILLASVVYVSTGLAYAELASSIPVSGGAATYGKKAFGNLAGFVGGWGLMLDYLICIVLFAVASAGYLTFFFPGIREVFPVVVATLILFLVVLNLLGIRESSTTNELLTAFTIIVIVTVLAVGFSTSFDFSNIGRQMGTFGSDPTTKDFLYAITLAMVTFIGIESIAQVAEETKDAERVIPKAHLSAVTVVTFFAVLSSILALGVTSWQALSAPGTVDNPVTAIASSLPFAGILAPIAAFAGFAVCLVSSNTGVVGVSRVAYSMSRYNLISRKFQWIHPKFRTPWTTIIVFSVIAIVLALSADIFLLGELYAFGALSAYLITNLSLIKLRFTEPALARPFKVPLNFKIGGRSVSLISIVGVVSCAFVLFLVAWLHDVGRMLAVAWFAAGAVLYYSYKKYRTHLPEIEEYFKESGRKEMLLVPVKLNGIDDELIDWVAPMAKRGNYEIVLLHVIELPPTIPLHKGFIIGYSSEKRDDLERLRQRFEHRAKSQASAYAVNARTVSAGITEFAKRFERVKAIFVRRGSSPVFEAVSERSDVQVIAFEEE